jgi:hypothetical protein
MASTPGLQASKINLDRTRFLTLSSAPFPGNSLPTKVVDGCFQIMDLLGEQELSSRWPFSSLFAVNMSTWPDVNFNSHKSKQTAVH